ncbi:hypothetical protein N7532_002416 [Penicillium argentinense]|uniref:gamma-glutamylcyclotransferase n=1 Tax=Penicillium argentinense TaxID=1131581 RepID=A0A9W9KL82_9EURO|nr:uncharacterized protein N7532_002416 [Penicillium argentinense]KAJ5109771.1 hypothetical protein N7532_002416 [Penicillium argentinense]
MHLKETPKTPTETLLSLDATTCPLQTIQTPTPAKRKYLYFAYGSNLSPTQMAQRCQINPTLSSKPLGIAFLPGWRWLICEAGYANVLPPQGLRVGGQTSPAASKVPQSGAEDGVYGILYEMDVGDERILDVYEGVDWEADCAEGGAVGVDVRPREQGEGDYNKWYLEAAIVRWFDAKDERVSQEKGSVFVLVYVDEERVVVSSPKAEYVPRMNRAIRECVGLSIEERWIEEVLRPFIPRE